MAWAEKLPSGRYRGIYRDLNGKRRSTELTYSHKAKAKTAAVVAEEKARRRHGVDIDAAKRPWGQFVEEAWWPVRDVADSTSSSDHSRLNVHLLPRWSDVPIGNIRKADVRDWIAAMRKAGVGEVLITRVVHLMSASMAYAVERDILDLNPCHGIKLESSGQAMERFLIREEFKAILDQLPTDDDKVLAMTLALTGVRWGEGAGLHQQRVDVDTGQIMVVETFPSNGTAIKPYPKGRKGKSNRAVRTVPLVPILRDQLGDRIDRSRTSCGLTHVKGGAPCQSALMHTTELGNPLRNSHWSVIWKGAVERSGVGGTVRIHDLRHTYASWLLQAGVPIAEVSRLMGHSSIVTTERYAHLAETPTAAVYAALRMDELEAGDEVDVLELEALELGQE